MPRFPLTALLLASAACGGSGGPRLQAPARIGSLDPAAFLLEAGALGAEVLRPPGESVDALEAARATAHGADRRRVLRDLARAHLLAAESSTGRDQRRHRAEAMRDADAATSGSHDDALVAEMAFVDVWLMWRGDSPGAATRSERFTDRYATAGELTLLAWMIRGQIAEAAGHWDEAATAYRTGLGHLGHPLYAYALYRTAYVWRSQGRTDEAHQALDEVVALGCPADAAEPTVRVSLAAAHDLGEHDHVGTDGVARPARCAAATPPAGGATDEERPPGPRE